MVSRNTSRHIQSGLSAGFLCMGLGVHCKFVKTETKAEQGLPSQVVKIETEEVVYVSSHDLVVKTEDGLLRHFPNVPDDKTVTVAGKELTIHDLQPGMKLQRTTITTTAPRMITTVKTVKGKVWRVNPPNSVILTLEDGTSQSFDIPKGQKFNVDGQETDAWGLERGNEHFGDRGNGDGGSGGVTRGETYGDRATSKARLAKPGLYPPYFGCSS